MANVSRDTVSKVEQIIEFLEEDVDNLEKLRSEEISINQTYNRILDWERSEEIFDAIEPLRSQIESIIKEWGKLGEDSLDSLRQLFETGPDNSNSNKSQRL
jgi:hypothetical protein